MLANKPWMTDNEWQFLKENLSPTYKMLEYGSGSSTISTAPCVNFLDSVEHNEKWYSQVKEQTKNFSNIKLHLVLPNNIKKSKSKLIAKYDWYVDYIQFPKKLNKIFDVVLIDGRGRQWVAETILPFIHSKTKVFIHDYAQNSSLVKPKRERYNRILNFYHVTDIVDTMVLLTKK